MEDLIINVPRWVLLLGAPVFVIASLGILVVIPALLIARWLNVPLFGKTKDAGQVISNETQARTNIYDYQGRGWGPK